LTYENGTQTQILWAGPPVAYPAGGASSSSVFALTAGATSEYQQPVLRGLVLEQGRSNQVFSVEGYVTLSAESSTTTFTITIQLQTSPGGSSSVSNTTLLAFPALTVTSYSSGGIWFKTTTINRGSGYGTSSVATNLYTYGQYLATGNSTTLQGVINPVQLATIDFSVNQWITVLGQFSTSSGTNSAQLYPLIVRGEN
jgi:hypothetical protein